MGSATLRAALSTRTRLDEQPWFSDTTTHGVTLGSPVLEEGSFHEAPPRCSEAVRPPSSEGAASPWFRLFSLLAGARWPPMGSCPRWASSLVKPCCPPVLLARGPERAGASCRASCLRLLGFLTPAAPAKTRGRHPGVFPGPRSLAGLPSSPTSDPISSVLLWDRRTREEQVYPAFLEAAVSQSKETSYTCINHYMRTMITTITAEMASSKPQV